MHVNTGTRRVRSQFRAPELPVRAHVCADCVRHRVRDYAFCVNIFLVLYHLTLWYITICDSC